MISTALFCSLCFFMKLSLHTITAALPSAVAAVIPKVIGGQSTALDEIVFLSISLCVETIKDNFLKICNVFYQSERTSAF